MRVLGRLRRPLRGARAAAAGGTRSESPSRTGRREVLDYSILIALHARRAVRLVVVGGLRAASWPTSRRRPRPRRSAPGCRASTARPPAYIAERGFPQLRPTNFVEGFPASRARTATTPTPTPPGRPPAPRPTPGTATSAVSGPGPSSRLRRVAGFDRDRYMGPFTRRTANPVLVVGQHVRPDHPLRGCADRREADAALGLLTVHGWGHTSLFLSHAPTRPSRATWCTKSPHRRARRANRTRCRSPAADELATAAIYELQPRVCELMAARSSGCEVSARAARGCCSSPGGSTAGRAPSASRACPKCLWDAVAREDSAVLLLLHGLYGRSSTIS